MPRTKFAAGAFAGEAVAFLLLRGLGLPDLLDMARALDARLGWMGVGATRAKLQPARRCSETAGGRVAARFPGSAHKFYRSACIVLCFAWPAGRSHAEARGREGLREGHRARPRQRASSHSRRRSEPACGFDSSTFTPITIAEQLTRTRMHCEGGSETMRSRQSGCLQPARFGSHEDSVPGCQLIECGPARARSPDRESRNVDR